MQAEILSGLHAPNKCRSLPAKTRAAVFLENSDENKNRTRRNRAQSGSVDYWGLSDEQFSTQQWVRSPSSAEIEAWAKEQNRAKSKEMKGLKGPCDSGHLARVMQPQSIDCFNSRGTE
jgi:hypothetical protein